MLGSLCYIPVAKMVDAHVARKHWRCTLERAEKFISSQFFSDINLYSR